MVTHAFLWIEHNYCLFKSPARSLYRSDLIGITRNDYKAFHIRLCGINHHLNGKVNVRAFFLKSHYSHKTVVGYIAGLTRFFVNWH